MATLFSLRTTNLIFQIEKLFAMSNTNHTVSTRKPSGSSTHSGGHSPSGSPNHVCCSFFLPSFIHHVYPICRPTGELSKEGSLRCGKCLWDWHQCHQRVEEPEFRVAGKLRIFGLYAGCQSYINRCGETRRLLQHGMYQRHPLPAYLMRPLHRPTLHTAPIWETHGALDPPVELGMK